MALTGNQRAILTARVGIARVGAFRVGFLPVDATSDGFYVWTTVLMPTTTWTAVKR